MFESLLPTDAEMAEFQAEAEALMVDTCTARRPARRPTGEELNEETGKVETTYDDIYAGKCKVQMNSSILTTTAQNIGGTVTTVATRYVHLPMSAPEFLVNDEITIDDSNDPQIVGKTFRVISPFGKTFATARRLEVQEP